jgi:hypothetical protein
MGKPHSGSFTPANPEKYAGDINKIKYRSSWERSAFKWCDLNEDVVAWASEETVIPYICKTDKKQHRYFVDLTIKFASGKVLLVEIKPAYQTMPPVSKKGKTKARLLEEALTYQKNDSKWETAAKYAKKKGWHFQIWTEHTLEAMGIKIMNKYKKKPKASK